MYVNIIAFQPDYGVICASGEISKQVKTDAYLPDFLKSTALGFLDDVHKERLLMRHVYDLISHDPLLSGHKAVQTFQNGRTS